MLLTLSTTHAPATDLGYLLAKHPDKCQSFELNFGSALVFYPEASEHRCSASLLLDIDPVALVRGKGGGQSGMLRQYVNDRPYVASSFLSVAIGQVFRSALQGRCADRPELAATPLPLEAKLPVVPCRGGEPFLRALFEPLGYQVEATPIPLDTRMPEWGDSRYLALSLSAELRLSEFLSHLYVLLPVLDDSKHYYVGEDEIAKLVARGEGWLAQHPERRQITRRYMKHQPRLTRLALEQLVADEEVDLDAADAAKAAEEAVLEGRISLADQRVAAVLDALRAAGARSVLDLGCGEGRLLRTLIAERSFERIVGVDVSWRALTMASDRLRLDRLPARQRERIELIQGALTYRDARLAGFDAACLVEVVEHMDPPRLPAFERVVFEFARPGTVILTTPNVEYNARFAGLPAGRLRHLDHRFEWTRAELADWSAGVAARHGYAVRIEPIGEVDPELGPPTPMAVFKR